MCKMNKIPPAISDLEIKYKQLFIGNEWVDSKDGSTFSVENPSTGEELCVVAEAKQADVDAAVTSARKAFMPGSIWRSFDPHKRSMLLHRLADLMERDSHYLASLESLDAGKIYLEVLFGDHPFAIRVLRYFAGWCDKIQGKTLPWDNDHFVYTKHEPLGVCGAILPWNAPLFLFCFKLGPCIATGNVLVVKPAELAPLTSLYLGSLIKEAGFPPGVINIVPGFGSSAGDALARHMDVDKIAFTGSTATGRLILKASAESNLKKVSLELGGKSPLIVFPDANLDVAVTVASAAIFSNNGQICCSGSRTFVHEDIYDEFVKKSVERAQKGVQGDPLNIQTKFGPQISKTQKEKILRLIESGKQQGCVVRCGGEAVKNTSGHFVQPTVLTDLRDDMQISQEEVFGPVQQIYKFKDMDEVIARANNTKYGLAAAVLTSDFNTATKVANAMEAGTVWINTCLELHPVAPFGGYKQSGFGRDLSEYALQEYTQVKAVIARL